MVDVYWERIKRKAEHYSIKKLGAFGSDLAALFGFFDIVWSRPAAELTDGAKAFVLSLAGFGLRALGRLREAVQPMQAGLDAQANQKDWENAASAAGNLSELYLTLGDVKPAVDYGRRSVDFADQSGEWDERMIQRTVLANALHHTGALPEAERLFQEAEAMQKESQPEYSYLYSLQGFQFCDLLLSRGEYRVVQRRGIKGLEVAKESGFSLLTHALEKLNLGCAQLLQALDDETNDITLAEDYLNQAVEGLRQAGAQEFIARGLLARATLNRVRQNFSSAWSDLEEARDIAEQGSMRIHLADYHLEAARLHLAREQTDKVRENLEIAKTMIEEMGYHRRDYEVEELSRMISGLFKG